MPWPCGVGDDKLRLVADRTIARIYRGGGINQIFQRWFGGGDPSDLLAAMIALQGLPE